MSRELDIRLVAETESTNALALAAAEDGAEEGTTFIADRQTAGRGRRETAEGRRRWFSPAGTNLYLSVVLRPDVAVGRASAITVAVGVELADLLREQTGAAVEMKWPNDLFVGDRKLGGILTEATTGPEGLKAVVVGIGINVNVDDGAFPDELSSRATSLRIETGRLRDRLSLALAVPEAVVEAGRQFERQGLEGWADRLERLNWLAGRRVSVLDGDESRAGTARTVDADGQLVVEFDDGSRREVRAGEIEVQDLCPEAGADDRT